MTATRTSVKKRPRRGIDTFTSSESLVPWIATTIVLGATAALGWTSSTGEHLATRGMPTIGFIAVLVSTLAIRSRQQSRRNEAVALTADRLATDELATTTRPGDLLSVADDGDVPSVAPYLTGMAAYTGVAVELLDHAIGVDSTRDEPVAPQLRSLLDDTRDLHDLLVALCDDPPTLDEAARIHALGQLWESSFREHERKAAAVDLEFFERWRARTVAVRRMRHGVTGSRPAELPYQV